MKISLEFYYCILVHVFFVASILFLAFLVNILYIYYQDLTTKSTDFYQYKITNFFYNFFYVSLYILIFILLSYYLRFLYVNRIFDLKILIIYVKQIFDLFYDYPFLLKIYLINSVLLLILCFVLFCIIMQTLCFIEFFKLHLFIFTKYLFEKAEKRKYIPYYYLLYYKLLNLIGSCYTYTDPFTGIIIYYSWRLDEIFHLGLHRVTFKLFMNKYYKILYYTSPILLICYECVFNNWVLVHFFSYMIIYSLVIIIKRLANSIFPLNHYLLSILSDIYYGNNSTFLICIPLHLKDLMFSNYLINNLKTNIELFFSGLEESNFIFIMANKDFTQDEKNPNMIKNNEGLTLVKLPSGKLYRIEYDTDQYDLKEEWIILQDNTNKVQKNVEPTEIVD